MALPAPPEALIVAIMLGAGDCGDEQVQLED
jgi:hypothetical protein